MDEEKDLEANDQDKVDSSDTSDNSDVPLDEQNPSDVDSSDGSSNKAGNGYGTLAANNRDAFARGLDENYNNRIARNQAMLNEARREANNPHKMKDGHEDEDKKTDEETGESNFEEKSRKDKLKDKANVLGAHAGVLSEKVNKARSRVFAVTNPGEAGKMALKAGTKKLLLWLVSLIGIQGFIIIFVVLLVALVLLGIYGTDSTGGACYSLTSVDSVCNSVTVQGKGTMSLDDYIAGVIHAEVGGMHDENNDMYKAGAVAARSYVLANAKKDGNGNCVVGSSQSFQVYKSNPSEDMISAAKETSGIVLTKNGKIYSSQYDAFCFDSKDSSNYYVCQGNKGTTAVPVSWVDSKVPSTYRAAPHTYSHGNGMSQYGAYYLITQKNMDYVKVLEHFYGDDGAVLGSLNGENSNYCTSAMNGNFQPLTKYTIRAKGLKKLNRVLTEAERNNLNNYVNSSVDAAGYGTGAGVATAGQSVAYGLEQYGYYLGYYWGGDRSSLGVGTRWGKNVGIAYTRGGNPTGPEFGVDCSGFVSWTIRNACNSSFSADTASGFTNYGKRIVNIRNAKPGDLLANSGHVILIVKNNGDGTLITVESSYSKGVNFNEVNAKTISGYKIVDMEKWYKGHCKSSR